MERFPAIAWLFVLAAGWGSASSRTVQAQGSAGVALTGSPSTGPAEIRCVPPPARGSYPARPEVIQAWIDDLNQDRIRAHAWDIWASLTSPSGVDQLPVWETWYSGHEVFEAAYAEELPSRGAGRAFERPTQLGHAARGVPIPTDLPERLTSFNRFSRSLAEYIVVRRYNRLETLKAANDQFDRQGTPVEQRKLLTSDGPVDASQIVLKPVFQFISGTQPTAIPYWRGVAPQYTVNLDNPEPSTWRQGVVVDPTGKLQPGTQHVMPLNNEPPRPLPVVALDAFYHVKLTKAEAEAFFQSFGATSGDDVGAGNKTTVEALKEVVKEGSYALMMAMHVTTKEIPNWTWQTFWWTHDPGNPIYGRGRPADLQSPWSNYNLDTAYYMVAPAGREGGEPLICFNPYLETNLRGKFDGPPVHDSDGQSQPLQIEWTGVRTNCMSCHRMAGYQTAGYRPDGFISPADASLFGKGTKTDFLWSIPTRAR